MTSSAVNSIGLDGAPIVASLNCMSKHNGVKEFQAWVAAGKPMSEPDPARERVLDAMHEIYETLGSHEHTPELASHIAALEERGELAAWMEKMARMKIADES